jgi:uncharacterized membrane protein
MKLSMATIVLFVFGMAVLGFADFAVKQTAGKISPALGTVIYAFVAIIPPLAWTIYTRSQGPLLITQEGIFWAVLTGLGFGVFTGILFLLFSQGVNLSIGTPVVRMGGIALAALLGLLVFREGWNLQFIIGFALAAVGIFLIATH